MARGLSRIATGALMMQLGQLLGRGILNAGGINAGFDQLTQWSGPDVWCLAFGYGLQLFFDFAGYSHIAIGAAKMLGFTVPENFARPFASTTPSIFWTRWHMSLSFWIRDYVFLPLATLRREMWWRNLALVISMVLFGVWHKASLLFVLWGCYHGVLLVLHRQVQQLQQRLNWEPPAALWTPLSWIVTITLVSFGWIFFRANSLPQASQMFTALVSPASYVTHFLPAALYLLVMALAIGYAAVLLVIAGLDRYAERLGTAGSDAAVGGHYDHLARSLGMADADVRSRAADRDLAGHARAKRWRIAVRVSVVLERPGSFSRQRVKLSSCQLHRSSKSNIFIPRISGTSVALVVLGARRKPQRFAAGAKLRWLGGSPQPVRLWQRWEESGSQDFLGLAAVEWGNSDRHQSFKLSELTAG